MRRIEPLADREQQLQLLQVGFDRRLHVGILQLAGQQRAVERAGAVHLAERSGGGRLMSKLANLLLPVGAQLGRHAALDEGPAHGRRFALQLVQFGGVFRRQRSGMVAIICATFISGPLSRPSAAASALRVAGAVQLAAEEPPAGMRAATPPTLAPTRA